MCFEWLQCYSSYCAKICNTFQTLKTSISLVHNFEDHIHCFSLGVLENNQYKYVWNQAKRVRLPLKDLGGGVASVVGHTPKVIFAAQIPFDCLKEAIQKKMWSLLTSDF